MPIGMRTGGAHTAGRCRTREGPGLAAGPLTPYWPVRQRAASAAGAAATAARSAATAAMAAWGPVSWVPARSARVTRIVTSVITSASTAISAETRNPREKPSASAWS